MIVTGEIRQVCLQEADDLGRSIDGVKAPVLRVDRIVNGKLFLGLDDELREPGLPVDLDGPHAEVRRDLVIGIQVDE